ncbi:RNA polymerase sigma factor SigF [Nocardia uniformis]|uniref:RNA polymerase sigma factor SigF n=1 Tax=Nocardia uniformis TaxID=53432 RepID=A0A849C938_9NOCA|nr:RNA polymerase sigma factor SigF [Nocardia uniformis]NNH71369.1 RNA polymerase sigma factor SigF [Nocardia uniformis]
MSTPSTTTPTRPRYARGGNDSYDNIEPSFARLAALDPTDPHRIALREELIGRCLPLAEHIARKFAQRGENAEDLLQCARVGVVLAVDRFDPDYGAPFLAFAVPTIMGEVRRHFRDFTWAVRIPRRLKEIHQAIGPAVDLLCQQLGRMPTATEIADELGIDRVEVTRALVARNAYRTCSLEEPVGNDADSAPISVRDSLGADEPDYGVIEDRLTVRPLIKALAEREREVLILRFFESQRQIDIAERLGVSQMQVSRVLARTLNALREQALLD